MIDSIFEFLHSFRLREQQERRGSSYIRADSFQRKEKKEIPSTNTLIRQEISDSKPSEEQKDDPLVPNHSQSQPNLHSQLHQDPVQSSKNPKENPRDSSPSIPKPKPHKSQTMRSHKFSQFLVKNEFDIRSNLKRRLIKSKFGKNLAKMYVSPFYNALMLSFTLVNIAAFILDDYSHRIDSSVEYSHNVSFFLEIVCSVFFSANLILKVILLGSSSKRMKNVILNFRTGFNSFVLLASWLDIILWKEQIVVLRACKRLRVLTIITLSNKLRMTLYNLIASFPALGKNYLTIALLMVLYAILGLHMFSGMLENRCRSTKEPVNGRWDLAENVMKSLCGTWKCPEGSYCGNPSDYGIEADVNEYDVIEFNFGITNFDNIIYSMLSVYHFLDSTGWSGITYNYWRSLNTFITAFFFFSLMIIGYVMISFQSFHYGECIARYSI